MTTPLGIGYGRAVGQRLRAVREARGLSLADVERITNGRWHRSTITSYELGIRAVAMANLAELAQFYEVDVRALLPVARTDVLAVLDLDRVAERASGPLRAFVEACRRPQEWRRAGRRRAALQYRLPMELTAADVAELGTLYDLSASAMLERLEDWGVLLEQHEPIASSVSERVQ